MDKVFQLYEEFLANQDSDCSVDLKNSDIDFLFEDDDDGDVDIEKFNNSLYNDKIQNTPSSKCQDNNNDHAFRMIHNHIINLVNITKIEKMKKLSYTCL